MDKNDILKGSSYFKKAKRYRDAGLISKAKKLVQVTLKRGYYKSDIISLYTAILYSEGKFRECIILNDEFGKIYNKEPLALMYSGLSYYYLGKDEKSKEYLNEAARLSILVGDYNTLSYIMVHSKYKNIISVLEKYKSKLNKANETGREKKICIANRLLVNENYRFALKSYLNILKKDIHDFDAYKSLIFLFVDIGDYHRAMDIIKKLLKRAPKDPDLIWYMSYVLFKTGKYKEAKQVMKRSKYMFEGNYRYHFNLGNIYKAMDKTLKAINHFTKAIVLNPHHIKSNINLGTLYYYYGFIGDAKQYFENTIKYDKKNAVAWYNLGLIEFRLSRFKRAMKCFNMALSLDKNLDIAEYNIEELKTLKQLYPEDSISSGKVFFELVAVVIFVLVAILVRMVIF